MLDFTPRRIVSLQPSATVILSAVGRLDRLVACTKYCADLVPEIKGRAMIVADSWTADASEIVAARPDLVIAAVPYQERAVSEILKSGARFLGLAPKTLADMYTDVASIAGTVAAYREGALTIAKMQEAISTARERHRNSRHSTAAPLKVFCEEWGKPLIASQAWVKELVEAAGGEFVGIPGDKILAHQVLHLDPDVFIAAWCGAGDRVPLERLIAERGWQAMSAVRTGRVFCVRDDYLNTPAPTLLHGLHAIEFALNSGASVTPAGIRRLQGGETLRADGRESSVGKAE